MFHFINIMIIVMQPNCSKIGTSQEKVIIEFQEAENKILEMYCFSCYIFSHPGHSLTNP